MTNILYLIGKSSSGKDTVKNRLIDELLSKDCKIKELVIYTTREIRTGEIDGIDYNFVSESVYQELLANKKIIEVRTYEKVQGTVRYFTVLDEDFFKDQIDYIVGVGTLESYNKLTKYFSGQESVNVKINPIYLNVENSDRLLRAMRRELREDKDKQNFEEVCRRFEADEIDYSAVKMQDSGITKIFENTQLETAVNEIIKFYNI